MKSVTIDLIGELLRSPKENINMNLKRKARIDYELSILYMIVVLAYK